MTTPRRIVGARSHYELLGQIASGAMGEVHLARRTGAGGDEVAIKRIRPELAVEPTIVQMFEDEAEISGRFRHPNIVRTIEQGRLPDGPWLAMEWVHGVTVQALGHRLQTVGKVLSVPLVLDILVKVLDALSYAHGVKDGMGSPLGVVHRDVSPQNVMVGFTGEVKLFDFGVGKAKGKGHQTNPGFVKGKLAYMSPEQIRNIDVDHRSDVFSVGVMAYEALVLVHPFYGKTDAALLRAVIEREPPDPSSVDPEIPRELAEILLRALEKDPERRFGSAAEMREAFDRFTSGRVFPAGPSLSGLMQELFEVRLRLEARARRRNDDETLVRVLRGELDDEPLPDEGTDSGESRGERMFADLPTADIDISGLAPMVGLEPISEPEVAATELPAVGALGDMVHASPVPLYVSRVEDGCILHANEPFLRLFGLDGLGSALPLYANPADRAHVLRLAEARGVLENHVVHMRRQTGERFWASLSVRISEYGGQRVLIGGATDVSERVAAESRLARRLGHERRLARSVAALLKTRDADPADVGLREALEHLRAATDADRVVLAENEDRGEGLAMHRRHSVGVEAPGGLDRIAYDRLPRWRALLERGEAVRGKMDVLPGLEQAVFEPLGVASVLAFPVLRQGIWLGVLSLEATEWRGDWTDEDVAALETMAGVIAGELARRRLGPRAVGLAAAWACLGAKAAEAFPKVRERLGAGDIEGAKAALSAFDRWIPAAEGEGAGGTRLPEPVDLARIIAALPNLAVSVEPGTPLARLGSRMVEELVCIIEELALNPGLELQLKPTRTGELSFRLALPLGTPNVREALAGDLAALLVPGARIGALRVWAERAGGEFRIGADERCTVTIELPGEAGPEPRGRSSGP